MKETAFNELSIITATHHRAFLLSETALPSLKQQTDTSFEWIVINDGCDLATRELIEQSCFLFPVRYVEIAHPDSGFGLCHARQIGLTVATGDLVAYLDDDNTIAPEFVAATRQYFEEHPTVACSMVQQWRRRDLVKDSQVLRSGVPFVSPSTSATVEDLLVQRELFDSNGFTHRRQNAPSWNPSYRIFADYEYFLQCLSQWGRDAFRLHPSILVNYVQRSDGVIGQSSYQQWEIELGQLLKDESAYPVFGHQERLQLQQLVHRWQEKANRQTPITAFSI